MNQTNDTFKREGSTETFLIDMNPMYMYYFIVNFMLVCIMSSKMNVCFLILRRSKGLTIKCFLHPLYMIPSMEVWGWGC